MSTNKNIKKKIHPFILLLRVIIAVIVFIIIGLLVWKFSDIIIINNKVGTNLENSANNIRASQLGSYKTEIIQSSDGYYIKIKDIVSKAASDEGNKEHYARLDITLLTSTKKNAELLVKNKEKIVQHLRSTLAEISYKDITKQRIMHYIKSSLGIFINENIQQRIVSEIYYEKLITQ